MDRVAELKAEYEKAMEAYNAGEKEVCFLWVLVCCIIWSCLVSIFFKLLVFVQDQEGSEKSDKEAPAAAEVEELTDEE